MSYPFRRDTIHYCKENGHVQMLQLKQMWGLKINARFFSPCGVCVCGGVTADRKGIRYKGTGGNTAVSWQLCLLLVRCAGVHDSP